MTVKTSTHCVNGHPWIPENRYTQVSKKRRYDYCRICLNDRERERKEGKKRMYGHIVKFQIKLECEHENIFFKPYPSMKDVVYCYRCTDYKMVTGTGVPMKQTKAVDPYDIDDLFADYDRPEIPGVKEWGFQ